MRPTTQTKRRRVARHFQKRNGCRTRSLPTLAKQTQDTSPAILHPPSHLSPATVFPVFADRIVDDLGSAFAMGCLGGSVWHAAKGAKNSPRGARFRGAYNTVTLRAPTLGGNFAVWGGLFSTYDCVLIHARGKEDPWNGIAAGALTGGTLAVRAGVKAVGKNALIGGVLLAIIEGLGVMISKATQPDMQQQLAMQQPQIPLPPATLSATSAMPTMAGVGGVGGLGMDRTGLGGSSGHGSGGSGLGGLLTVRPEEEFSSDDFSWDTSRDFEEEL